MSGETIADGAFGDAEAAVCAALWQVAAHAAVTTQAAARTLGARA